MRARVLVSIAVAAGVALGTAGCEFMTPQSTTEHYDASDGVSVTIGKIDVRNAILFTKEQGITRLVVTMVNRANTSKTVTIEAGTSGDHTEKVVLPANSTTDFGGTSAKSEILFPSLDVAAGSLTKVFFTAPSTAGASVKVPVLTGAMEEYSSLVPTPAPLKTSTPAPTITGTPIPSSTPSPQQ